MDKPVEYKIIKLNLARHCLNYIINAYSIKVLHIPYYICPALYHSVKYYSPECKLKFYHINENFLPLKEFAPEDFILYPDYFGINRLNVEILAIKYKNLIVDNAQAYFAPKTGLAGFYSLRKFLPVKYGAYLYTREICKTNYPTDTNTPNKIFTPDYDEFVKNELYLNKQPPLIVSSLSELPPAPSGVQRLERFYTLHKKYKDINELKINLTRNDIPFIYPCLTAYADRLAGELERKGKTILRYWNPLPETFPEHRLYRYLVPVPLY